jgi:hypothetical protein
MEYVCIVSYKDTYSFMKRGMTVKVPVQYAWVGRAGSLPPPPAPLAELPGGGGGVGGRVQPGDFEQGRGDLWQASRELKWQVFLASKFGGLFSRVNPAGCHGKLFWRVILAHSFGGLSWLMKQAGLKERKEKERKEIHTQ